MNKQLTFLDFVTILSFAIGVYALEIALQNLEENRNQNNELKEILDYLDTHLQDQDNHLIKQDKLFEDLSSHLESQDRQLENLTRGE